MNKKNRLIILIIVGLVLGVVIGYFINTSISSQFEAVKNTINIQDVSAKKAALKFVEKANANYKKNIAGNFSILSDIFLRLIKMIIAPLVFSVLVVGVAKVGNFKTMGRIGLKTMIYFTSATIIALVMGLVIVNTFEPGKKMKLELPEADAKSGIENKKQDAKNFIAHVIPDSIFNAMANNEVLPIVVFSLFFGIALASIGAKGDGLVHAVDTLSEVMFKVTNYVMNFAPIGVFGAICAVIIMQGLEVLSGYAYLIACFFGGLLVFVFGVLFVICLLFRIPFFKLLGAVKEPILLAFSTASSESAMPKTIEALEKFGISNRVVSFVLPLGYSFNMDGSIMYMTFATVFIAQAYGIQMDFGDQVKMLLILLVTSKGMAGIPRASLVVISGMLAMFKIPGQGLILLLAVDQLLDMGRSATNVVGNAVASAIVAKSEGELKLSKS
jgi:Na+/H+-dicarboxylate symporter